MQKFQQSISVLLFLNFDSFVQEILGKWVRNYTKHMGEEEAQILKILYGTKMKLSIKDFVINKTKSAVSCGFGHI